MLPLGVSLAPVAALYPSTQSKLAVSTFVSFGKTIIQSYVPASLPAAASITISPLLVASALVDNVVALVVVALAMAPIGVV